ncbi:MAG: PQQ-like beta-propeller repeat protein [Victivallales bacterium]|nr:PQQ-like beta-propeller repeat protein [Victivallales bacterium]
MGDFFMRLFSCLAVLFLSASVFCADWPDWRGPDRDGVSKEKGWDPQKVGNVAWGKELGVGYAGIVVLGNRAYTLGNRGGKDIVYCLDVSDGKEIWTYSYNCPDGGGYAGPLASPVISGGELFTLSREGHVHCLEANTGKLRWSQTIAGKGPEKVTWSYAGALTVEGGLVLVNAGEKGTALDIKTGEVEWTSRGKGGYASLVVFGKGRYLAMFSSRALKVVETKSCKEAASFEWVTSHDVNAADPIVEGSNIFITSGYGRGGALLSFSGGKLKKVWENKSLCSHFSTPVLFDGHLYGVNGNAGSGQLVCIELKSGKGKWSEKSVGFGSLMVADGKIIYLNERGTISVAEASPKGFKRISSADVLRGAGKCWTMPVLSNGRIFCRGSNGKMVCLDVTGSK